MQYRTSTQVRTESGGKIWEAVRGLLTHMMLMGPGLEGSDWVNFGDCVCDNV